MSDITADFGAQPQGDAALPADVLAALNAPHPDTVTEGALSPDVIQALNAPTAAPVPRPPGPSVASDIQQSAEAAVPKGISDFVGSLGALGDLRDAATAWSLKRAGYSDEDVAAMVHHLQQLDVIGKRLPRPADVRRGFEAIPGVGPLYQSQTGAGKYVGATIEGATSMPFAPAVGAFSGAGSEAGPQVFGEKYGRLLGSLAGAGAGGVLAMLQSAPEKLIRSVLGTVSQAELDQAQGLMDAATRAGTPITGAEALGQVIGPNRLNEIQRVLESTTQGAEKLAPMMAARPAANAAAMDTTLGTVAPPVTAPGEIAPRVQAAAEGTVDQTRQTINEATAGLYARSAAQTVPEADFAALKSDKTIGAVFEDALAKVRGDPVYAGLKDLPDNAIGVLDAVKKKLGRIADTMQAAGDNTGAAAYLNAKSAVENTAKTASPDYAQAVGGQATMREQFLDPLERSPIGQLAEAKGFQAQARIIFDPNPLPGSERAVGDAVRQVAARDPEAAQQFVRARLEQAFNEVSQQLTGGPNQFGGAGYRASIMGNAQQARNLRFALDALPNGPEASRAFHNLMRIFQAQGTRLRQGSMTAFNTEAQAELSKGGAIGEIFRQAGQPGSFVKNLLTAGYYNRNLSRLAEILTDPKSVEKMAAIAKIEPASAKAKALVSLIIAGESGSEPAQGQQ